MNKSVETHPLVVKDLGMEYPTGNSKRKSRYVIAKCLDCTKERKVVWNTLQKGNSIRCTSCAKVTHGDSKKGQNSRLRNVWNSIKQRCDNKNSKFYKNYGGRGITYCNEWRDYSVFKEWANSNGYEIGLEIDRTNNNKEYSPDNCRWVDKKTNGLNRRKRTSASKYRGVTLDKRDGKWYSRITVDKVSIHIGTSNNELEAAKKYDKYVIDNNLPNTLNTYEEE